MGTGETVTHISVITLNEVMNSNSHSSGQVNSISSLYNSYGADAFKAVSWSGIDLKEEDGWNDLANGTLFVRNVPGLSAIDPFDGKNENRDDVEFEDGRYVYLNGYSVKGSDDDLAIYHMVFPRYHTIERIDYPHLVGLHMLHARRFAERAIVTWVYKRAIQLRIAFRRKNGKPQSRSELYKVAVEHLPTQAQTSDFVQELKRGTAKEIVSGVSSVAKTIWSMW